MMFRHLCRPLAGAMLLSLVGCVTTSGDAKGDSAPPSPGEADGGQATKPSDAAATQVVTKGPLIPFKFAPNENQPWGLRVARHRTLPSPNGNQEPLHFDSEENSRIWAVKKDGNWVLDENLTSYSNTRNGDSEEDQVLKALQGVTVGIELSRDGHWVGAVDADKVLSELQETFSDHSAPDAEKTSEFAKELEKDWRLGAEIYLSQPVYAGSRSIP